jgi:hypothetical protein
MNNSLEIISKIEKGRLSSEQFFQSLLEQGYSKGLLTNSEIEDLQYDCLALLAHKVDSYSAGDSSSILVEKTQEILASNMFTIGLWLKTYQNPDEAITAIKNERIDELYQKGRKRIDTMLAATKAVHTELLQQLINTKNVFYYATVVEGIKGFFKLYYPDISAHEIHITADYPVYNTMPKLVGIEFMHAYLNAIYLENQFCLCFSVDDIHHLLCGYQEDYQELLINLYEQALTAAIGCILTGTDAHTLNISDDGAARLNRMFVGKTKTEILRTIQGAAHELKHIFCFSRELDSYIQRSLSQIANNIEIAVRNHSLDHVFYTPIYPELKPRLIISSGDMMGNEQYRQVVNKIMQCRFTKDKIAIIREQVHSFADLDDILQDADFTRKEIVTVLHELSLSEIAAFSNKYSITSDIETMEYREQEQVLRECLFDYVSVLSQEQRDILVGISESIEWA